MSIHDETLVLDTHIDIRWPETPDWSGDTRQLVDLPKMRAGGMNAAIFIAYVQQGRRDTAGHAAAGARAEAMLQHIAARANAPGTRFCATPDALEACFAAGHTAVLSAVENGYAMGRELDRIGLWRSLGAVYLTLTHDGHNDLSDSARPKAALGDAAHEHGGLSALGEQAVAEMNARGLMVDVSHVAKAGMLRAAAISRSPVVATHTACTALCLHPRGLDDEQLDALRACGGLTQITAVPAFLRQAAPNSPAQATVADLVDHVDHAVRRIGLDHVGISSDFDGGGAVMGWADAAETGGITAELQRRGYGAREIGLLWSGNFLRVWRQVLRLSA